MIVDSWIDNGTKLKTENYLATAKLLLETINNNGGELEQCAGLDKQLCEQLKEISDKLNSYRDMLSDYESYTKFLTQAQANVVTLAQGQELENGEYEKNKTIY